MAQQIEWWNRMSSRVFLENLKKHECIPFIGPEACKPWIPLDSDIARRWAKENDYPLQDSDRLSRVAQFLAIKQEDNMIAKEILSSELKKIKPPDFRMGEFRDTPPAVLADLNLPVYITTNYDHIIEAALESRGKQPISDFCRWNEELAKDAKENEINSIIYEEGTDYKPTPAHPLVYHLHGTIEYPKSMVLTEKDYTDFVIFYNKEDEKKVTPSPIRRQLSRNRLLFVGYSLDKAGFSLPFSVIFQTVISSSPSMQKKGIAVQVKLRTDNNTDNNTSVNVEKVERYLEQYTNKVLSLDVYWGDSSTFSKELRQQLEVI
jgi:hypothetical protein